MKRMGFDILVEPLGSIGRWKNGLLASPTPQGWGYAVFGKVSQGIEVMQAIEGVATTNKGGMGDVPVEDVVIEKVTIKE